MVAIDPLSQSPMAEFSSKLTLFKTTIKILIPAFNILLMKVDSFNQEPYVYIDIIAKMLMHAGITWYGLQLPMRPIYTLSLEDTVFNILQTAVSACSLAYLCYYHEDKPENLNLILVLGVCILSCFVAYFMENQRQTAFINWQGFEKDEEAGSSAFVYSFMVLIERMTDDSEKDAFHLALKIHFDRLSKQRIFKESRLKLEEGLTKSKNYS